MKIALPPVPATRQLAAERTATGGMCSTHKRSHARVRVHTIRSNETDAYRVTAALETDGTEIVELTASLKDLELLARLITGALADARLAAGRGSV